MPEPAPKSVADAIEAVDGVDGWLSEGQVRRLFDAAGRVPDGGRIVEIGSFRGRSTIVLALGSSPAVEVVAIDPHAGNDRGPQEIRGYEAEAEDDHRVFEANLERAGVLDRVTVVRKFSGDAHHDVHGEIDLLWVDGAHRFSSGAAIAKLVLVAAGGILYTLGGVVYGLKRPDPSPRWFGFHEVFHSFTVLAFVSHYVGVSLATYSLR